jgi:nucleotide-binding universal stress UspA family protein
MFEIKRILFPTDFSEHCRSFIPYAEAIAGRFDAQLTLLHIIEPPAYNSVPADLRRVETEEMETWLGPDRRYFRVNHVVERGEAAQRIAQYACANHSDLIVMPTRGMGLYRRLALGSNTFKVLHDAECPVWTGVHLREALSLGEVHFRKILCAIDFLASSSAILAWAKGFAEEYQAELTLLHVTPEIDAGAERQLNGEYAGALRTRAAAAIADLQGRVGTNATMRVESGDPAHVVRETALEISADLLVIGRSAVSGMLGRLSKHSYSIISRSPCPVVSV